MSPATDEGVGDWLGAQLAQVREKIDTPLSS